MQIVQEVMNIYQHQCELFKETVSASSLKVSQKGKNTSYQNSQEPSMRKSYNINTSPKDSDKIVKIII